MSLLSRMIEVAEFVDDVSEWIIGGTAVDDLLGAARDIGEKLEGRLETVIESSVERAMIKHLVSAPEYEKLKSDKEFLSKELGDANRDIVKAQDAQQKAETVLAFVFDKLERGMPKSAIREISENYPDFESTKKKVRTQERPSDKIG